MSAKEEAEELLADYDCDCIGLATAIKQKLEARDKQIKHYVESLVRVNHELAALKGGKG